MQLETPRNESFSLDCSFEFQFFPSIIHFRTHHNISWKCFKFIPCNLPDLASELVVMTDREEFVSCPATYKTKNLF